MVRVVLVMEAASGHPIVQTLATRFDVAPDQASNVYRAVLMDLCSAISRSGGDLALAQPTNGTDLDPTAVLEEALGSTAEAPIISYDAEDRIPDQFDGGDGDSQAILRPRSPLVERTHLDTAAMRLRRHDVVIGPTADGRISYLAVGSSSGLSVDPGGWELAGIVQSVVDAEGSIDFLKPWPTMATEEGLAGTMALLTAFETAGRDVAPFTRAALASLEDEA